MCKGENIMPNPYAKYPKYVKELPAFRVPKEALMVGQWYICYVKAINVWRPRALQFTHDKDEAYFENHRFFCLEDIENRAVPVEHLKQTL